MTGDPLRLAALAFAAVSVLVLAVGLAVAVALPYRDWDAFSLGTWSRLIQLNWPRFHFPGVYTEYNRPLFYVLQAALWHAFGFHLWLGRLLSFMLSAVLVGSVGWIAAHVARTDRRFAAALGVLVVVIATPFEQDAAAGMTDGPVAAMLALTAALLVTRRLGRARCPSSPSRR